MNFIVDGIIINRFPKKDELIDIITKYIQSKIHEPIRCYVNIEVNLTNIIGSALSFTATLNTTDIIDSYFIESISDKLNTYELSEHINQYMLSKEHIAPVGDIKIKIEV